MTDASLLIFGLGYTGRAVAVRAAASGMAVTATSRSPAALTPPEHVRLIDFAAAGAAVAEATHILMTAAPGAEADPALAAFGPAIAAAPHLRWVGYLSTTGVYGDRGGGWVDEDTPVAPTAARALRRVAAEQAWAGCHPGVAVDLFRVAGIYGPGRSAFDDLRAGRARIVVKPDHAFGRIHLDDIAGAVLAAMSQSRRPAVRVLNLTDNEPAASGVVIEEAAGLLGIAPPPRIAYADAVAGMSEMGRSFWAENRRVASAKTTAALARPWLYPSYREGLRAILAVEQAAHQSA